jgi:hypothetical protein
MFYKRIDGKYCELLRKNYKEWQHKDMDYQWRQKEN